MAGYMGPCLCGDTACPSCGPAQGYDPARERVLDYLYELFDGLDLSEEQIGLIADRLSQDGPICEALLDASSKF